MRRYLLVTATAAFLASFGSAFAGCNWSEQPISIGSISGDMEKDSFGRMCTTTDFDAVSSIGTPVGQYMQVGASMGDLEKDTFGMVAVLSGEGE